VYGSTTPRIVRVTYRLVPERKKQKEQQSFRLFRQESQELKFTPEDEVKAQGMLMVGGVRSLKLEFEARAVEENPSTSVSAQGLPRTSSDDRKAVKVSYEKTNTWGPDQIKKFKKQLPNFVIATFTFWDSAKKKSQTLTFRFVVIADDSEPQELKADPSPSKRTTSGKSKDLKMPPGKSGGGKGAGAAKLTIGLMRQDNNVNTSVVTSTTVVKNENPQQDWCEVP